MNVETLTRPAAPRDQPREDDDGLSLRDIVDFLALRRWTIMLVAAGVIAAAGFLVFYLLSPTYEASASIIVDASQVRPVVEAMPPSDFEKMINFQTQIDIIKSATLAAQTVDRLDLTHRRVLSRIETITLWAKEIRRELGVRLGIAGWQKPIDYRALSMEALIARLDVQSKPQSTMLKISYRAGDPQEAAQTVNTLVALYVAYFNSQIQARAAGVVAYLETQVRDVGDRMSAVERELLAFRQSDRVILEPDAPDAAQTTTSPNATPARPRADRRPAGPPPSLVGVTDSPKVGDELKTYVLTMEEELRKMQAQFAPDYPPLLTLQRKIAAYVAALNELPRKELELFRLRRDLDFAQDNYKFLKQNLERARVVELSNTNAIGMISILEPAVANDAPISPKPKLILPAALVFGFMLGVVIAATAGFLDHRIHSERDLTTRLRLRSLGVLPRL